MGQVVDKVEKAEPAPILCRIVMPLPENYVTYHRKLAHGHPDLEFEVLSRMEIGNGMVAEDIRATGSPLPVGLEEELRSDKKIKSVELLEHSSGSTVYRVTMDMTPVTKIFKELSLLMRYPVSFRAGIVQLLVVAQEEKVRELYSRLKAVAPDTTIASIRHDAVIGPEGLLTQRQLEVFKLALSSGYWDVPRRISLTDMAAKLGVSKSTVSETVATIEKKLIFQVREGRLIGP